MASDGCAAVAKDEFPDVAGMGPVAKVHNKFKAHIAARIATEAEDIVLVGDNINLGVLAGENR